MGCLVSHQRFLQLQRQLQTQNASKISKEQKIRNYQAQNNNLRADISQLTQQKQRQSNQVNVLNSLKLDIAALKKKKAQLQANNNSISNRNVDQHILKQKIQQLQLKLQQLNLECIQLIQNSQKGSNHNFKPIYQLGRQKKDYYRQLEKLKAQKMQLNKHITLIKNNQYIIMLKTEDKVPIQIVVQGHITIKQLKQIIYNNHNDKLIPQLMALVDNGFASNINQKIQHVFINPVVNLTMKKEEVWGLEGLKTDKDKADDIFEQMGVVFMPCGHAFSRTGMIETIKDQIGAKQQYYFTCPYSKQGQNALCQHIFSTSDCLLIAGYQKDQLDSIQEKLAKNYLKKSATQCPKCMNFITRDGASTKKRQCPLLNCGEFFCMACREPWKKGNTECLSQACNGINQIIAKAPRDRVFSLTIGKSGQRIDLPVPSIRACPGCKCLVMNYIQCKHTKCFCGKQFCFICLKLKNPKWQCGDAFQYCAPAQNQNFGPRK